MLKAVKYKDLEAGALSRFSEAKADPAAESAAGEIIEQVQNRGDAALFEYTERFDGARLESLKVSRGEIDFALSALEPEALSLMQRAAENIKKFHERQIRRGFAVSDTPGIVIGQRLTPIERVGIYVPGGTASYPSTVLMNAIPARLAGVGRLIICTPPGVGGAVSPAILAAAHIAGVDEIYKLGGAQAIAAMAYGTETVPKVYKIVGPGNAFVAAAKRRVFGRVDIDMIAGPSDVLIIADGTARAEVAAADMLAQAEHDVNSSAVLITDSEALAERVGAEIEEQLKTLPRAAIAEAALRKNGMIIITPDIDEAVRVSNEIAPEHLEILTREPFDVLGGIKNAGSVFLGECSPEALGDYFAGPNHTLPTMGTSKFRSPLSVDDFVKKASFTYYGAKPLRGAGADVAAFARLEGLEAHARSVEIRFKEKK